MEDIQSFLAHNYLSFLIPSITCPGKATIIISMTSTKGTTTTGALHTHARTPEPFFKLSARGKISFVMQSEKWSHDKKRIWSRIFFLGWARRFTRLRGRRFLFLFMMTNECDICEGREQSRKMKKEKLKKKKEKKHPDFVAIFGET